ncbi:thioredoxin-like protein [Annulohypoxylon moriforme]|nr:thioredoxin-like protein [Annulohypoxylon moriforme]
MHPELQVDVFFSFRSPYSYLAAPRLADIAKTYNVDIRLRPVLPLIVRSPEWFVTSNPLLFKYIVATDCPRVAEYLNLPYQWPDPDPVNVEIDADGVYKAAKDQPNIYHLVYLGILAEERGQGIPFANEVSRVIWSTDGWDQGNHLAGASRRAGLDLAEMDAVVLKDEARLRQVADTNLKALEEAGHWGVPTCVFQGEPFFGQDRIDLLLWRLKQNGLVEKAKLT